MISDYNTLLPNISTEFAHASTCNDYIFQEVLHTHFFGYSQNLNDFYTFLHSFGPLKDSNPFYIEHFTLGSLKTTLRNLDQSIIRKKKNSQNFSLYFCVQYTPEINLKLNMIQSQHENVFFFHYETRLNCAIIESFGE